MSAIEQKVRELSKLRPGLAFTHIALDYLVIGLCIYLGTHYFSWPLYLLLVMLIGGRMHSLGIISHDIVHYRFMQNRALADVLGSLLTTWPLFYTIHGFRSMHLRHHSKLNSPDDPDWIRRKGLSDWTYPMSRAKLYRILIMDLLGLNYYQVVMKIFLPKADKKLRNDFSKVSPWYFVGMGVYYATAAALITYFGVWEEFALYWAIPYFTWLKFIRRLRAVAEHFAIPKGDYLELTRTTQVNWLTSLLIAPRNIGLHVEHHRWSAVPYYNLPKLHHYLVQTDQLKHYGFLSPGYFTGVLKEATQHCELNMLNL